MAKDYLCKECLENNNGWCKKQKAQVNKFKDITECKYKVTEIVSEPITEIKKIEIVKVEKPKEGAKTEIPSAEKNISKSKTPWEDDVEIRGRLLEVGNILGKREMLLFLQKACLANGGTLTLKDICQYDQICRISEMIFKVENYEGEVQESIRKSSMYISENQKLVQEHVLAEKKKQ